ncbi:MAG: glucuronyl hydrolase, partial [Candidatus Symbiothrix sp.]|nr:glucuronyl hydrolase [Candidatus Symbiothrix sp.]
DSPKIPNDYRDSSSGAIIASALLELSNYTDENTRKEYFAVAEKQLKTLASPVYTAKTGTNGNFILMHGAGNIPQHSEIDAPLSYGDYYYVEALLRYEKLRYTRG